MIVVKQFIHVLLTVCGVARGTIEFSRMLQAFQAVNHIDVLQGMKLPHQVTGDLSNYFIARQVRCIIL